MSPNPSAINPANKALIINCDKLTREEIRKDAAPDDIPAEALEVVLEISEGTLYSSRSFGKKKSY